MQTSPPAAEDKLTALHSQLVDAVAELRSSDKWAQMLAVAARFTTYSPSNLLRIAVQRPDAMQVAGIRNWNSLGSLSAIDFAVRVSRRVRRLGP